MWKNSKNYLWLFLYSLYSLKNFSIPVWDAEGEGRVTDCFVLSYFYELPCICWLLGKFMANTGLPPPSGLKKNCTRTNVGEEKKKKKPNGWHASYKHAKLQMLSGSPSGARKLADVHSLNVLMTTLKQALKLQKSLIKKGGLRGNHFLFQRGFCFFVFFYLLGIFLRMNWERISSYKQTASSFQANTVNLFSEKRKYLNKIPSFCLPSWDQFSSHQLAEEEHNHQDPAMFVDSRRTQRPPFLPLSLQNFSFHTHIVWQATTLLFPPRTKESLWQIHSHFNTKQLGPTVCLQQFCNSYATSRLFYYLILHWGVLPRIVLQNACCLQSLFPWVVLRDTQNTSNNGP